MSTYPPLSVPPDTRHRCDNCEWEGGNDDVHPICDLWERLTAGGVVPSGQCPECQALVYPVEKPKPKPKPKKKRGKEPYPEHVKLKRIQKQSQTCGEFLEWLQEQDYVELSIHKRLASILAEFFEIDENKLEQEKRAMLEACRQANEQKEKTVG